MNMAEEDSRTLDDEFLHEEYAPAVSDDHANQVILSGSEPREAAVDVIFVQGLASTYARTWSVEDPREPGGRYHWLRDKLPRDIPTARILAFEYNSSWYDDPAFVDIEDCAKWLLDCIVRDRRHPGQSRMCRFNKRRPIVLVGHSFGGLVIKQALVLAGRSRPADSESARAEYANYMDILSAISGIIFLGTPHRGTTFTAMASWKMAIGSLLGVATHDELVHLLTLNNPVLRSLHKQFNSLLHNELLGVRLTCFYETLNVTVPPRLVVDSISAILDQADNIPMEANHMQLNKFRKGTDKNYDTFLEELLKTIGCSRDYTDRKFAAHSYNDSQASFDLQNLKRWLNPSDEAQGIYHAARLREQRSAAFTCTWITSNTRFIEWDADINEAGALWIYGQAGSGKSVLCSYMIDVVSSRGKAATGTTAATTTTAAPSTTARNGSQATNHSIDECETSSGNTILYFLNGIDKEHERPWNFLGTLIHQLLAANVQNDRLFKIALEACGAHRSYARGSSADHEVLRSLLQKLLSLQERVYIFIDGLEENGDLQECLRLLSFVRDTPNTRIAFFSQDITEVYEPLSKNFIVLQPIAIREHTSSDVKDFVELKVNELIQRRKELESHNVEIKDKLQHTADGIFQWVNESIRYLNSAAVGIYNFDECLKDMPVGLHSSYEKIFARLARAEPAIRKKVQSALRWLAVAARPLSARELWTAIRLESSTATSVQPLLRASSAEKPTDQEIVDELYELLGSLLRVSRAAAANEYYVQLVHPSLRVAITGNYVDDNSPAYGAFQFSEDAAQLQCARLCMRICTDSTLMQGACKDVQLPPLVDYAWTFWAYHCHYSGQSIDSSNFQFDQMILAVCRDTTVFLNALVDFSADDLVKQRLELDNLASTMAIKMAQESLVPAAETVVELSTSAQFGASLHKSRKFTDAELVKRPQAQYKPPKVEQGHVSAWIAKTKGKLVGRPPASLRLEVDSVLSQRPMLDAHRPKEAKSLTKAARSLRLVALRFAIEPVSTALTRGSSSRSLSTIQFLARTANFLEECGNYPYWDLLTPNLMYSSRFAVADGDSFFGPAKFALQALEGSRSKVKVSWTEDRHQLLERQSSLPLQITTAHQDHVRKIHQMPGSSYVVASTTHYLFNFNNDQFAQMVVEPIKQAHVQGSLMLRDVSGRAQNSIGVILAYAPEAGLRNEYNDYVAAIPQLLKMFYIQYIMALFNVFGQLTQTAIAVQISNLKASFTDLDTVMTMGRAIYGSEEDLQYVDIASGLALVWLRLKFLPWWTIMYTHTTWWDLWRGLRHPAAFLSIDGSIGFWSAMRMFGKCFTLEMSYFAILSVWSTLSQDAVQPERSEGPEQLEQPEQQERRGSRSRKWTVRIMGAFIVHHGCLLIERCVFRTCHSIVTAVATGRVMFSTPEAVGGVVSFSVYYWLIVGWNLMLNLGRTALAQGLQLEDSTWWPLGLIAIQIALIVVFSRYIGNVGNLVFKLFYPLMLPWWIAVRVYFLPWAFMLRIFGTVVFLSMTALAVLFANQYWKDPYGLKLSIDGLNRAKKTIRGELEAYQDLTLRQIGSGLEGQPAIKPTPKTTTQPAQQPTQPPTQASTQAPTASTASASQQPTSHQVPPPSTANRPPQPTVEDGDENANQPHPPQDQPNTLPSQVGTTGSDPKPGPFARFRPTKPPVPPPPKTTRPVPAPDSAGLGAQMPLPQATKVEKTD